MKHTLTARDVMNDRVRALHSDLNAIEAVDWLLDHGYSGAPVVDDQGHLQGVLTEHDCVSALLDAIAEGRPVGTVGVYMTQEVERVRPEDNICDVARLFTKGRHRRLLVTDEEGRPLGLIARRDLLRGLQQQLVNKRQPSTYDILQGLWR